MELPKAVDNLCLFDWEFQASADKFLTEMGGNGAAEPISTMKDLQEAIHKYSNVKFLEILLHGRPGMIDFANKGTMVGSYLGTMMQGTLFLAKNARVLFDSCNIVEGDYGDKFMADLAKKMLIGRGGRPSTLKPRLLRYFRRKWTRFSNGLRVRKVSTRCFLRA